MKDLEKLFNNPEESVRTAEDPLARLLRGIWADEGMTALRFNELLNNWLDSPISGVEPNKVGHRSTTRGNLIDSIKKPRITWVMFVRALQIMNPEGMDFTLGIQWTPKVKTLHTVYVPFKESAIETKGVIPSASVTPVNLASQRRWSGRLEGTKPNPAGSVKIEVKDEE